jgi:nucleoside-diphosphate-sugar epimerase
METTMSNRTALILGATGGAGYEIAKALARKGWRLRAMHRTPEDASRSLPEAEWVLGDAMNRADVLAAAHGVQIVVHAVNPPGYRNWAKTVLPMIDNTIAAAEAADSRIVLPGTIYNYGPDAFPLLREDSPQTAHTRKGAIRVELERRLEQAAARGVRSLILRGGDFFGPHTGNSWFAQGVAKPGAPLRQITYPGKREAGHAWAYLPDFAETIARLLERESDLGAFARFHFGGHYFARGVEMAEAVRAAAGDDTLAIKGFPWAAVIALSPFVALFRELLEMRYLWNETVQLDNSKLVRFLGAEPHTPTDLALRRTLEGLGCLATETGAAAPLPA